MEIRVVIKKIDEQFLLVETSDGLQFNLPKNLKPEASLEQELCLSCATEPAEKSRQLLNELISNHD